MSKHDKIFNHVWISKKELEKQSSGALKVPILSFILAIILDVATGTLTGLTPGIHINLVAAMILSLPLENEYPLPIVTFITSLAITYTCIDFIPSIYLGAPEEDTYLSVLPGHTLLLEGKGHETSLIAMLGVLSGVFLAILSLPILLFILPKISEISSVVIPYTLIAILV